MTEELLPNPEIITPAPEQSVLVKNETPQHHGKSPILKFLLLGFIVAIILAAIGGAYVLGKNSVYKELNPTAPAIPPADPDVYEPTPTPDPTADWMTYNSVCGFKINYPQAWNAQKYFVADSEKSCANLTTEDFEIIPNSDGFRGFYVLVERLKLGATENGVLVNSLENFISANEAVITPRESVGNKINKTYGAYSGIEFDAVGFGGHREFIFEENDYVYSVRWVKSEQTPHLEDVERIIESIKFK